ncbi:MAG: sigma-54-dependent Fis family transcriptional regulator [Polyangiaceae bacterium]|nr:sigma-54-dependent Fis family transcriptional regulator [Polyangiaceae bacterium]
MPSVNAAPPSSGTVVVIDDEPNIRRALELVLDGEGYRVLQASTAEQGLEMLGLPEQPVDAVLLDLKLPGMSGHDMLERIRGDDTLRDLPVIVISGHATVEDAVTALKLGAADFFEKPLNRDRVVVSVRNAIRTAQLSRTVASIRSELEARFEMIGSSAAMQKVFGEIEKVAPTKASVLVTGESGTGKELVCRAIHRLSSRCDSPFVKVNCAAIPRELIESELFGHERGSFTGAQTRKRGLFEQAHGGTLLLDEIGDMDLSAQAKVLRALQSGEVLRVGSEHVLHVDVRVLAATNKDLERHVAQGSFREDLYYRLNVFPIRMPALRERVEDVPVLARAFIATFCRENGLRAKKVDPAVLEVLTRRSWPGNVRELKNVIERAAILASDLISIADLPEDPHSNPFEDDDDALRPPAPGILPSAEAAGGGISPPGPASAQPRPTLREYRDSAERSYLVETLHAFEWNISKAAVALGIERTNLHKKIRTYRIERER